MYDSISQKPSFAPVAGMTEMSQDAPTGAGHSRSFVSLLMNVQCHQKRSIALSEADNPLGASIPVVLLTDR